MEEYGYAVVENGVVVNTVASNAEFAAQQGWIQCPREVGPGWLYDGVNFTRATQKEPEPAPPVAKPTIEELKAQLDTLTTQLQQLLSANTTQ